MKLLKKRSFAVLITIAVVILATLLGVRGSLNRLARDAEAMFYDGVYLKDEKYTQPGIDSHLSSRMNSALGFASIMKKYPQLDSSAGSLMSAREELLSAKSIHEKYSANEKMGRAFAGLLEKAEGTQLSLRDMEAMSQYKSSFTGAGTAIQNSLYNQQTRSYMDGASLLTRLVKPFLFVKSPQLFS